MSSAASAWARPDALRGGAYDRGALLREAYLLAKMTPKEPCEILSVLDRYFWRGRIGA